MKALVLIVEDDPLMGNLLLDVLKRADFEAILVEDAPGAFLFLKERMPDIILLDIILPGVSGFDFLAKIKENQATKMIPVLILSNLGDKSDIEKGRGLGAVDYLVKSNTLPKEIIKKIEAILVK